MPFICDFGDKTLSRLTEKLTVNINEDGSLPTINEYVLELDQSTSRVLHCSA